MQFWAVECSLNGKYSGLDGVDSGSYFGPGIALNAVPTGFKCSSLQVVNGSLDHIDRLPDAIASHARDARWSSSEFPNELAFALINVATLAPELMAFAGWTSPPMNREERNNRLLAINAELATISDELTHLQVECDQNGLVFPG